MTQPIHLIADIYCMPIPEDASAIETHVAGGIQKIVFSSKIQDPAQCGGDMIALPPGNWEIIRTTKECTEEQAKEMVKELPVGQRWHNYNGDPPVWWHSAKESLRSLLISKGLDVNKNYVLIKKVA